MRSMGSCRPEARSFKRRFRVSPKRLVKSSGNKEWDEAVLRAVDRTASLPGDNGLVPPALILVFRPKD